MCYLTRNLASTFRSNYPEFPESCPFIAFPFGINVSDMLVDGPNVLVEQLRHLGLRQPNGLVDQSNVDAGLAVLTLIQQQFGGERRQDQSPSI
jgi:hypothetical protein